MRSSRAARETSRYFDTSSTPAVLPRRSTRTSLARFAYTSTNGAAPAVEQEEKPDLDAITSSDIEDALSTSTITARKRKRTTTITESTPRRAPTRTTRSMKTEIKTEIKPEPSSSDAETPDTKPPKPRGRVRKPARRTTDPSTGTIKVEPPTDWEEIYALVKEMRLTGAASNAAVDTMGCERLAQSHASARDRRFHTLVALMLSSQTKDTVTAEAMRRLYNELPPYREGAPAGLNLENMLAVEPEVLNELIGKVGFHNNKTNPYLSADTHPDTSNLPPTFSNPASHPTSPTIATLTSLPGVGPKMAHLCMSATHGWNRVEGIGVDVHVHRITNLWGWHNPPTKNPEETRKALEAWLPRIGEMVEMEMEMEMEMETEVQIKEEGLTGRRVKRERADDGFRERGVGIKKERKEREDVVESTKMEDDGEGEIKNAKQLVKREVKTERVNGVIQEPVAVPLKEERRRGV
ncbi:alpha,alpha-trehalase nth1 [Collariella sp. IMI 366227]|nr:alpha,alpha-trehalase nth1 [Collariella sp. IMI 366227]